MSVAFLTQFTSYLSLYPVFIQVKRAAAGTEKAWQNAGESVGLQIWRIVKFKVERY